MPAPEDEVTISQTVGASRMEHLTFPVLMLVAWW